MECPDKIHDLLYEFGFAHIEVRDKEIRCARDDEGNKTSIRIKLEDNEKLYVQDYAKSKSCDIFSFIIQEKSVTFKDIIKYVNRDLGICGYNKSNRRDDVFGGFYKRFKKSREYEPQKALDESVLNQYHIAYSKRFHDDGVSLIAQKKFGIRYDVATQRIVIPIYNPAGELIGAKGRINYDDDEEEKYLYLISCKASETLYGYSFNYQDMTGNTVYICESEKSVMQAYSCGMCSFVGLGGNLVSDLQCKLLAELFPRKIVFLLDEGLDMDITMRNIERLQSFTRMLDMKIGYWDYRASTVKQPKCSPTDLGGDRLNHVLRKEIVYVR